MKAVFITGGTTGMGMELAKLYAKKGWKVGVCGRDKTKFDDNFQTEKDQISFYQVDVANRAELKAAIADFSKTIGLDLLIANAGIGYKFKTKIPDFEWSYKMVHVNFLGVMYAFEAALDVMVPRSKGQLVAISSIAGYNGLPGVSAYSATKAAVQKYCESLHIDLRQFNIHVTSICPGFVDTPLTQSNNHKMPFIMSAPKAAQKIAHAIEKKKMVYAFPFFFATIVRILGMLPRTWYRAFMSIKAVNYSKE
ncbi:SDR family NAD(P)-dependent oxidoreductase [Peredibacter sp. HCB2-198]|uniref:SDR family NAD(P)-dependent oxidoreductase n=1 Tax=Peredibacter sp. HCB2-198 TaxID=3383025 RepID=UPI0038B663D5